MSVYPCVRGIHTLDQDILLYIFSLNGDMFSDESALRTTRIASQVCQSWRNLMLATPSLWARLIDMDRLCDPWRVGRIEELIGRSGSAPLWIRAEWTWLSANIAEFVLRVIEENWHRLQKLVVQDQSPDFNFKLSQLAYGSPAPCLETFNVTFGPEALGRNTAAAPLPPLFGGHVPWLRKFHFDNYIIKQREPWLPQLHSLVLGGAYNVHDALAILVETHSLRELEIYPRESGHTLHSSPIVSLSHLKSLDFSGDPYPCTTLLEHIKIPLGCSLNIAIFRPSEDASLEAVDEQLHSVVNTFNSHARRILLSNIFQIVHLIFLPDSSISFMGVVTSPVEYQYCMRVMLNKKHASNQLATIMNGLDQLDLSDTTTFRLSSGAPLDIHFLSRLSSIHTLLVDERSLDYLMVLQDEANDSKEPRILFPHLQVLDMTISRNFDGAYNPVDHMKVVEKFIVSRLRNGCPIATLNTTKYVAFHSAPDLDALSEAEGLRVLYKHTRMDGIFEHICGSGDSARRIVMI